MKNPESPRDVLLRKMRTQATRYDFYRDGEKTLVGLSGGADSVCLLHALLSLRGQELVRAVHVNHLLRGDESERDETFCRALCETLGVPLAVRRIDVAALSMGAGIEETARKVRYKVYAEEAEKQGCATVSLAHHADDNLETMLFHLCRGAGVTGLSGMPPVRALGAIRVVRPLLTVRREEVLLYLTETRLSHVDDTTNEDTRYTRNFIRQRILPLLKEINPAVAENAGSAAVFLRDATETLEKEADAALPRDATKAPRAALLALDRAPFYMALRRMVQNAGGETLDETHTEALRALLENGHSGKRVMLPAGLLARLDADLLRVEPAAACAADEERAPFSLSVSHGKTVLPNGGALFLGEPAPPAAPGCFSASTRLRADVLPSLCVRERQGGDAYRYFGMTHTLKKMLCGADSAAKTRRPVLCGESGVVWFPGFPAADGFWAADGILITYYE